MPYVYMPIYVLGVSGLFPSVAGSGGTVILTGIVVNADVSQSFHECRAFVDAGGRDTACPV